MNTPFRTIVLLLAALTMVAGAWVRVIDARQAPTAWFCPMHPDVTAAQEGRCNKCGMALVAGDPFETREYRLGLRMTPAAVRSGAPFTMNFTIAHPASGRAVRDFEVVHDKRYHLFVVSQDMTFFAHVHPDQQDDGSWSMRMSLPKPGYYRLLSDFLPKGGSPQFVGRTLVTAGFDGDLASSSARIEADRELRKISGPLDVSVTTDPAVLVAGQYGHFTYAVADATTGQPVTDLQPYLGAFGHTLLLSEDMVDYVHSHPVEGPESDITKGLGGPRVTFEGYMPRPGRYRAWTQFQRKGEVTTVSFTFTVKTVEDAARR